MLAKRIIPCLDVANGEVVKGVRFADHVAVGGIIELARRYQNQGADELVFYDITASAENRTVDRVWVSQVAREISIPFCVAGGIRSVSAARLVLEAGADKVSINSPALENPALIDQLAAEFGSQCVVIGIDSFENAGGYQVYQFTGSKQTIRAAGRTTDQWLREVQERGAGEVVMNCMNADGTKAGFDLRQLSEMRPQCRVPLIASGGAGEADDFQKVFSQCDVDGALAAGIFHRAELTIPDLKAKLIGSGLCVRT